jgi:hypothetical protein
MKFIVNVFLALALTISAAFIAGAVGPGGGARAANASNSGDALMIIRFNQKNVNYQDKLFYVVREAVKAKPGVVFDVVAVTSGGESKYGQEVADNIARLGVAKSQISLRNESSAVSNEEVRIFVR